MSKLFIPRKNWAVLYADRADQGNAALVAHFRAAGFDKDFSSRMARAFAHLAIPPHDAAQQAGRDELANYLAIQNAFNGLTTGTGKTGDSIVVAPHNASALSKSRADIILSGSHDETALTSAETSGYGFAILEGTVHLGGQWVLSHAGTHVRGQGNATNFIADQAIATSMIELNAANQTLVDVLVNGNSYNATAGLIVAGNTCTVDRVQVVGATTNIHNTGSENTYNNLLLLGAGIPNSFQVCFQESGANMQRISNSLFFPDYTTGGAPSLGLLADTNKGEGDVITGSLFTSAGNNVEGIKTSGQLMQIASNTFWVGSSFYNNACIEILGTAISVLSNKFFTGALHAVTLQAAALDCTVAYNDMKGFGAAAVSDAGTGDTITPNVT